MDLLILDADGVFMNETPYWKTALAAALTWHGLDLGTADRWEALADRCFQTERIQRLTKARGCNSNWDLAAVMIRALEPAEIRSRVARALREAQWPFAVTLLARACERLYTGDLSATPLLAAFGIDRHGPFFQNVVAAYQQAFLDRAGLDWPYARHELAAPAEQLDAVFGKLGELGYALGVCTSRDRHETLPPMRALGILRWFDPIRIATHDDAVEAQQRTGIGPLHKPHWFPLACAIIGLDAAVEAVLNTLLPDAAADGCPVFVGDTTVDFRCAQACLRRGLRVEYIHVDSGLTDEADLNDIRGNSATLGVAPDLSGVVDLLGGPSR